MINKPKIRPLDLLERMLETMFWKGEKDHPEKLNMINALKDLRKSTRTNELIEIDEGEMLKVVMKEVEKIIDEGKGLRGIDKIKRYIKAISQTFGKKEELSEAEILTDIGDMCIDYNGYETVQGLKGLIDDIKEYAYRKAKAIYQAQKGNNGK